MTIAAPASGPFRAVLVAIAGLVLVGVAGAAGKKIAVRYFGLHSKQAKVSVNRRSFTLAVGETAKGQVTLISATKREVILRIKDDVFRYVKGQKSGTRPPTEIMHTCDSAGMIGVSGAVNGAPWYF
jgi:hypothetical protein